MCSAFSVSDIRWTCYLFLSSILVFHRTHSGCAHTRSCNVLSTSSRKRNEHVRRKEAAIRLWVAVSAQFHLVDLARDQCYRFACNRFTNIILTVGRCMEDIVAC